MDNSVLRAIARWPNVPAVYGWLSLDRRGRWLLRGQTLGHDGAREFIDRNYARDERGCWYFQNGPQRVFVALEYTPWVYRLERDGTLLSHIGNPSGVPDEVFMDETGAVLFVTALGIGLLDDRDLALFSASLAIKGNPQPTDEQIAQGLESVLAGTVADLYVGVTPHPLLLQPISSQSVAARFAFNPTPAAEA